ncbi:hypothetical protein K2O51_23185 [Cupriavidus pinatubonensis]|uniref:hypothetical protein n=1 Tax=Cupriavidus pinatubonensis TaxID=248026 RepID=UPI001C72E253|nr:hypothetical protein [Cupriavidus pinatubonensis]QYY30278.1 hypothetical protein K2O51_23185 [Cupriavidus pinatubonensis]
MSSVPWHVLDGKFVYMVTTFQDSDGWWRAQYVWRIGATDEDAHELLADRFGGMKVRITYSHFPTEDEAISAVEAEIRLHAGFGRTHQ